MIDAADSIARTAASYDSAPYPSNPIPRFHPARLAAIANFFGLPAPDVATARTLEIGCASGGHIIPLAATFPAASFVGIDISPVQIDEGRARAGRLNLHNIELACRSITDFGADQGSFDYIVCHGVYSWTPEPIREAVLEVCRQRLSRDGIAVISYNVLPGWRLLQILRDCALLHAGADETLTGRARSIRQVLDLFKLAAQENDAYGQFLRNEAQRFSEYPDGYLVHEFFEESHAPVTFTQFAAAASRHGLAYLGDADLSTMVPEVLGNEAAQAIRALSKGNFQSAEQYLDMLTGRTLRETLLVHDARNADIDRSVKLDRLSGLHFVAAPGLKRVASADPDEWAVENGSGTTISATDAAVRTSVERLIARLPSSSCLDDLAPPDRTSVEGRENIASNFMRMLLFDMVQVSTEPIVLPSTVSDRPKAWFVASSDAAHNAATTATGRHEEFALDPLAKALLPRLDGVNTRDDIADHLFDLMRDGHIVVRDARGKPLDDPARLRQAAKSSVDNFLATVAKVGLLTWPVDAMSAKSP